MPDNIYPDFYNSKSNFDVKYIQAKALVSDIYIGQSFRKTVLSVPESEAEGGGTTINQMVNNLDGGFAAANYLINQHIDGGFAGEIYTPSQIISGGNSYGL